MTPIRFNVYGRYDLELERSAGKWVVYRRGEGKRREDPTIFVPAEVAEAQLETYLEDLLHEEASPGTSLRRLR